MTLKISDNDNEAEEGEEDYCSDADFCYCCDDYIPPTENY